MFKKISGVLVAVAPLASQAATDLAPITAAGTDGALVMAAITGVLVAFWAGKLIYRKFFG